MAMHYAAKLNAQGIAVCLDRVRQENPRLATAIRVAGRPHEWTVFVTLPEGTSPGKVEDVIELKTSIADEPVTEITVSGEVLPKPAGTPLPPPAAPK